MLTESKFDFGRWEEKLPDLVDASFDLIYTDPPYEMDYKSNIPGSKQWYRKTKESESKFQKKLLGDSEFGVGWAAFAKEAFRLLKNDRFLFLHCNLGVIYNYVGYFADAGFNIKGQVIWDKSFSIGGDLKAAMKRDWEPIIYMAKGKPQFNPVKVKRKNKLELRKRISEIDDWCFPVEPEINEVGEDWRIMLPKKEKLGFPTQKPLALCTQVIELTTKPDEWVLDPFSGSGTISLAARLAGRQFYACEADQDVYKKFKTRIVA